MEDPEQENWHPTKRRKLNDVIIDARDHNYITVAETAVEIQTHNVKFQNSNDNKLLELSVSIIAVVVEEESISVEIAAPWLRQRATLLISFQPRAAVMLNDCSKLQPLFKIQKEPLKVHLASYDATLRLEERSSRLRVRLLWHNSTTPQDRPSELLRELFSRYIEDSSEFTTSIISESWHVREFYDNVHIPQPSLENSEDLKIDLIQCRLYPFQRRAVRWLLSREGVAVDKNGKVSETILPDGISRLPTGFYRADDAAGQTYYANPALHVACDSLAEITNRYGDVRGGLLGEAMGLGKTVEMIALICLHTMTASPLPPTQQTNLRPSRATLIITPPAILEQWKQEIAGHAPSMRVYHYTGVKANSKVAGSTMIDELCNHDIVLTTYSIIAKELHYVKAKPDRALRNRSRYEPPKSPLDQILWWRVCLDEAQMVESGISAAAQVARLIPRINAWAVTGTPIKQTHKDLFGLLLFLKYEPWCFSPRMWEHLVLHNRQWFRRLISEIAIRHSKELVRDELRLPPQHRHTISMAFTNIEQAHYAQLFYEMYQDLGLNRDGSPANDDCDPASPKVVEKMRTWLTRLRQTCLHPEVGGRNRRALGRNGGPLRTVEQVLDVMIDQTETTVRAEQRLMLLAKVRQGQIFENAKSLDEALLKYSEAYEEATIAANECRKQLAAEIELNKRQAGSSRGQVVIDEYESDKDDDPQSLTTARQRLRAILEVEHLCIFFMANIFFQKKSNTDVATPDDEVFHILERSETEAYDKAKEIRAQLLKEVIERVNKSAKAFKAKAEGDILTPIPRMSLSADYAGIESRKIYEKLFKFCEAMDKQADQLTDLRKEMAHFVQQALVDEDEGVELKGDEYESSTQHQDKMYAYMEVLRALQADRSDAVTGQENILIKVEMKNFLKAAKEGEGPAPELLIKLLAEREELRINTTMQGSLRGIIAELRALVSSLEWSDTGGQSSRAKAEIVVAEKILQDATALMTGQTKSLTLLEQEVAQFRNTMNARLEYYRALQKISDMVAPYREEDIGKELDQVHMQQSTDDETKARNKFSTSLAKSRYLLHLKGESVAHGVERLCTICQSEFETGTITSCGHVFCKEDIQLWYREHGNCPICKRKLRHADFFDITYKPSEMAVQADALEKLKTDHASSNQTNTRNSIYSNMSEKDLFEIKNIDIRGASFGSKVDTICRHLHWLRESQGGKTLVFSQYREVLDVLARAFRQNNITYTKCDEKGAVEDFKSNPSTEVFLLHAKAYSAGLNLVVARHVILCEPLINTALELQAIARIHRIGQQSSTTVWMYLVSETVEQSIYNISVKRRLAHIGTRTGRTGFEEREAAQPLLESDIDAANSNELQEADLSKSLAPGRNGGEMVDQDDLWPCLFGNISQVDNRPERLQKLAEELIPSGDIGRLLRIEAAERR